MGLISRFLLLFKAKASSAMDKVEDPREMLDYAYEQQQELLRKTKQGLIEVATAKTRLEKQADKLRGQVPKIGDQDRRALGMGREDLAVIALQRKQTVLAELEQLDVQAAEVAGEQKRLAEVSQQLAARIEEFRIQRDVVSARYSAARAQVRVSEAVTGVSGEFADLSMALGRAVEKTERMQARASAIESLVGSGALALPTHSGDQVEAELRQLAASNAVEGDLAALKAELGPGTHRPALGNGDEQEERSE